MNQAIPPGQKPKVPARPVTGESLNLGALPGYKEAVHQETNSRDAAFFDAPSLLCGKPILQMNTIHWLTLDAMESSFIRKSTPRPWEIPMFLWLLNPAFAPDAPLRRWLFTRSCRKLNYIGSCNEIYGFVKDTFAEMPGGNREGGKSYYSSAASIVHSIAFHYHWSEADILRMPLKRVFQYFKAIRSAIDPNAPRFNPSDSIVSKWLLEVNQANQVKSKEPKP